MEIEYKTVTNKAKKEIIIKKSRFLSYVFPVETEDEIGRYLENIGKKHRDAAHNVFAYVLGKEREIQRSSDDGEPSGTAGQPVLEVITNRGLTNVLVVVTRYFGGIKLGRGGLIRAYSRAAAEGIDGASVVIKKPCRVFKLTVDYANYGAVQKLLEELGLSLLSIAYTSYVNLEVLVPITLQDIFLRKLVEVTSNSVSIEKGEIQHVSS